jgi:23S rRNA pseudouridine1911/1915/1917 synthase
VETVEMAAAGISCRRFRADRGDARERVDRVLVRRLGDLPRLSRTRVQDWIAAGWIRVNGRAVARPSRRLAIGDAVEVVLPPAPPRVRPEAQEMALAVLHEDDELLALDKPAGLVVHPAHGHRQGTLVNGLMWLARGWTEVGPGGPGLRPALVHRLDRGTSGVLLVAKTAAARTALGRALAAGRVRKEYLAVVYGAPPQERGCIARPVGRDPADPRLMTAFGGAGGEHGHPGMAGNSGNGGQRGDSRSSGNGGRCGDPGRPGAIGNPGNPRAAATCYELLARSVGARQGLALLRCRPLTGRTHQIRVHLRAVRLPLVGDPLYGEPRHRGLAEPLLAAACRELGRQALHAHRLLLRHPASGAPLVITAPLPADLVALLAAAEIDEECARLDENRLRLDGGRPPG